MKTKLEIQLHRTGITICDISKIIAMHNEGINLFLIKEIVSVIKSLKKDCPAILKNLRLELIEDEGKLNVYENGNDITYTIQENEYYTLVDNTNFDKHIAGEDALLLKEQAN